MKKLTSLILLLVIALPTAFAQDAPSETFASAKGTADSIWFAKHKPDTIQLAERNFYHTDATLIAMKTYASPKKKGLFGKKSVVKKGLSFGPLPVVAYDQDKGFQYGAVLNIFDYGDGESYPHPRQQWYLEASAFTKGTQQYVVSYDTKFLIPNIRFSAAATLMIETALDFYGFNGYESFYDNENIKRWKDKDYEPDTPREPEDLTAYYRMRRLVPTFKADFLGNIWENKFFWEAGYHFSYFDVGTIDRTSINKGKEEEFIFEGNTLYDNYKAWGIIRPDEADGGFTSSIRVGLQYDTRDLEAAPSKGLWIDAHFDLAPGFLGTTHPFYRYNVTFRHYVPIIKKQLTFAYRLNYQGTLGNYAPYYVLPYYTNVGWGYDRDGLGGYRTVRGILRDRVQALDAAFWNVEFRWKFVQFVLWRQNIQLALNAFTDGAMAVRHYDTSYKPDSSNDTPELRASYDDYMAKGKTESPHMSAGVGFRFIMNHNFIVAAEYAMPFDKQDGSGFFYLNTGYLF